MITAVLAGTLFGAASPASLEESNVIGGMVGLGATVGGVILAVLLLLTLQQHSETELRAVELAGILEGIVFSPQTPQAAEKARESLDILAKRFDEAFVGEDQEKLPEPVKRVAKQLPENEASELLTAWRRLHAIATRRVHWTFWLAMALFLFWSSAATMTLAVPVTLKVLLNATMTFFASLIVDIDNPFAGIYNLKNPFKEAETD